MGARLPLDFLLGRLDVRILVDLTRNVLLWKSGQLVLVIR